MDQPQMEVEVQQVFNPATKLKPPNGAKNNNNRESPNSSSHTKGRVLRSSSAGGADPRSQNFYGILSNNNSSLEELNAPINKKRKISTATQQQQQPSKSLPATSTAKPKPIVIKAELFNAVRNVINATNCSEKPLIKKFPRNAQILAANASDKALIIGKLKEQMIEHFSYSEPQQKPVILILSGFMMDENDKILAALKEANVPATKATRIGKSAHYPIYSVKFPNGTKFKDIAQHRHIDGLIVHWDRPDKERKKPTQCYRCQVWGHSASNCNRKPRCVKCNMTHDIGKCARLSREQEGSPICCNCGKQHPANSTDCEAYKRFVSRRSVRQQQQWPQQQQQQQHHQFQQGKHAQQFQPSHQSTQHFQPSQQRQRRQQAPEWSNQQQFPQLPNNSNNNNSQDAFHWRRQDQVSDEFPPSAPHSSEEILTFAELFKQFQIGIGEMMRNFSDLVQKMTGAKSETERQTVLREHQQHKRNGY